MRAVPRGARLLRIATPPAGNCASSTQSPLGLLAALFRQTNALANVVLFPILPPERARSLFVGLSALLGCLELSDSSERAVAHLGPA